MYSIDFTEEEIALIKHLSDVQSRAAEMNPEDENFTAAYFEWRDLQTAVLAKVLAKVDRLPF